MTKTCEPDRRALALAIDWVMIEGAETRWRTWITKRQAEGHR